MTISKYLALLFSFKDVSAAWEAEKGEPKPFFLKKRVMGSAITLGSVGISAVLGYEIDKALIVQSIDLLNDTIQNAYAIYQLINIKIIPAVLTLYGIIMAVKGKIDANMREKKNGNGTDGKTNEAD